MNPNDYNVALVVLVLFALFCCLFGVAMVALLMKFIDRYPTTQTTLLRREYVKSDTGYRAVDNVRCDCVRDDSVGDDVLINRTDKWQVFVVSGDANIHDETVSKSSES